MSFGFNHSWCLLNLLLSLELEISKIWRQEVSLKSFLIFLQRLIISPIYQFFSTWIPSIWLLCDFAVVWSHWSVVHSEDYAKPTTLLKERPDHDTESSMPYSLQIVCGFFYAYVPQNCEPFRAVRRGLRFIVLIPEDLKVLTICRCRVFKLKKSSGRKM